MIVKGQLKDAQLQLVSSTVERDLLDAKTGQLVFVLNNNAIYFYDGTRWRTLANPSRDSGSPLGQIVSAVLNEAEFQAINGSEWVLSDGRDVSGSEYHTLTGNQFIPDLRGMFLRGSNDGGSSRGTRSDGNENPDGIVTLGAYSADKFLEHDHTLFATGQLSIPPSTNPADFVALRQSYANGTLGIPEAELAKVSNVVATTTGSGVGGNENAPKSITVNHFIKINRDLGL